MPLSCGCAWVFPTDSFTSAAIGNDLLVPVTAPLADGHPQWQVPGRPPMPTRMLSYSPPSGIGRILEAVGHSAARDPMLETVFTSPLAAALQTMARQGHGVAWIPRSLVEEDLATARLVWAGPDDHSVPVEIRIFRSLRTQSPAAERFWEVVLSRSGTR